MREAPMESSELDFFKAEWKGSDTGSAHWASSLTLAKYVVVTTLFHNALGYWLDFWYLELKEINLPETRIAYGSHVC
jgi:hypothetical protein